MFSLKSDYLRTSSNFGGSIKTEIESNSTCSSAKELENIFKAEPGETPEPEKKPAKRLRSDSIDAEILRTIRQLQSVDASDGLSAFGKQFKFYYFKVHLL